MIGSRGFVTNTATEDNPFPVVSVSLKEARIETDTSFDKGTYSNTQVVGTAQDAYLSLASSGANKDIPFTTTGNYTISDATKIEITGGYLQHVGEAIPDSCTFFHRFDSDDGYSKNGGATSGTFYGNDNTGSISGGQCLLTGDDASAYKIASADNFTIKTTGTLQEWCAEFDYTPSIVPNATTRYIFTLGTTNSRFIFDWRVSGSPLYLTHKNSAGADIFSTNLGTWSPTQDQKYRFRISVKIDTTTGSSTEVKLFIDDEQFGSTITGVTGIILDSDWSDLKFGNYSTLTNGVTACKIDNIAWFEDSSYAGTALTKHLGYYTDDNLYVTTTNDSQLTISTPLLTAAETATKTNGHLAYMHSVDSRVSWKAGSEWTAPADATLRANADEIDDVNTNISSLATPSDTLDTRIFIKTDSITSKVVLDLIRYTVVAGYITPGTYTSGIYDSGYIDQSWGKIYYGVVHDTYTSMSIKIRASNTSTELGDYSSDLSSGDETYVTGQYMQIQITLSTTDECCTPEVNWIGVRFVPPIYARDDL